MSKYYDKVEIMPRGDLEALQLKKLRALIAHLENSPFYAKQFKERGLGPESVSSLGDLQRFGQVAMVCRSFQEFQHQPPVQEHVFCRRLQLLFQLHGIYG